ncbi:MAG: hypothetical protein HYT79_02595 [Elusimicrobia bacterium]|nr:hypothetical protein [Elusimicrobiota bacterium]
MPEKLKLDIPIDLANSRPWKGIVWHHSATADGPGRNWDAIVRFHTSYRIDGQIVTAEEFERKLRLNQGKSFLKPWKDVGYHGGTEWANGQVIFHWGRPLSMIGAHAGVKGASNQFNEQYLGLCAIGNFDTAPPKPEHTVSHPLIFEYMKAFYVDKVKIIPKNISDILKSNNCSGVSCKDAVGSICRQCGRQSDQNGFHSKSGAGHEVPSCSLELDLYVPLYLDLRLRRASPSRNHSHCDHRDGRRRVRHLYRICLHQDL